MSTTTIPTTRTSVLWRALTAALVTAAAFDLLFWKQHIGVNLPLYSLLIAGALLGRYGWHGLSAPARAALLALAIVDVCVVVNNSVVSILAGFALLFVLSALAHEPELRSLFYAVPRAFANVFMAPIGAGGMLSEALSDRRLTRTGWRWFRLALIPVALLVLYFLIYRKANPRFDELTSGILGTISGWFDSIFSNILTPHAVFFLFALVVSAGLLFRFAARWLVNHERQWSDVLLRVRTPRPHWMPALHMNALERERQVGVILLVLMNALLLVVNAIDIQWLWFGFEVPKDFSLKQFVHEGTWLLIISILLSMVILLRLSNGNQNFYWRSGSLRTLAVAWIVQNLVLGISVFLRNYHYIHFHGLAYKRIGVIVFLGMVMVGLVTLWSKIRHRRSLYHVLRVNAWAALAVLVGLSTVNWDMLITRYNLDHWNQGEIDVDNYLEMSDKVLPLLYAGQAKVEQQIAKHMTNEVVWIERTSVAAFVPDLDTKRRMFLDRWARTGWQGWNHADVRTYAALQGMGLATLQP